MALNIGIIGLPNVGKSTLFNALLKNKKAPTAPYPFTTIDKNIGVIEVPDERLYKIAEICKPNKIIPATVEFVDIAGLIKGASKGEGLGNQFLAHIRECQALAEVVRIFQDQNIPHVYEKIDPKNDIEIVEAELILADLQTLNKRLEKLKNDAKAADKKGLEAKKQLEILEKLKTHLESGKASSSFDFHGVEKPADFFLLTDKKIIYIVNISEDEIDKTASAQLREIRGLSEDKIIIPISAKIEEELSTLSEAERKEYLADLGLRESGLEALAGTAYKILDLETFFTTRSKELRAWTIKKNTTAQKAAGVIHTDFEKGFIAAEVIAYEDYINFGGESNAKEHGKMRVEGRDYIVKDGDVINFKFNV